MNYTANFDDPHATIVNDETGPSNTPLFPARVFETLNFKNDATLQTMNIQQSVLNINANHIESDLSFSTDSDTINITANSIGGTGMWFINDPSLTINGRVLDSGQVFHDLSLITITNGADFYANMDLWATLLPTHVTSYSLNGRRQTH